MLEVVTGYRFSQRHARWYSGGTRRYFGNGQRSRTRSMSAHCVCGEPVWDGDPICGPAYERENWSIVHANCCTEHDHPEEVS